MTEACCCCGDPPSTIKNIDNNGYCFECSQIMTVSQKEGTVREIQKQRNENFSSFSSSVQVLLKSSEEIKQKLSDLELGKKQYLLHREQCFQECDLCLQLEPYWKEYQNLDNRRIKLEMELDFQQSLLQDSVKQTNIDQVLRDLIEEKKKLKENKQKFELPVEPPKGEKDIIELLFQFYLGEGKTERIIRRFYSQNPTRFCFLFVEQQLRKFGLGGKKYHIFLPGFHRKILDINDTDTLEKYHNSKLLVEII